MQFLSIKVLDFLLEFFLIHTIIQLRQLSNKLYMPYHINIISYTNNFFKVHLLECLIVILFNSISTVHVSEYLLIHSQHQLIPLWIRCVFSQWILHFLPIPLIIVFFLFTPLQHLSYIFWLIHLLQSLFSFFFHLLLLYQLLFPLSLLK
jgi:hypothetical protein